MELERKMAVVITWGNNLVKLKQVKQTEDVKTKSIQEHRTTTERILETLVGYKV